VIEVRGQPPREVRRYSIGVTISLKDACIIPTPMNREHRPPLVTDAPVEEFGK
jgi:hypothetical protein